MRKSVKKKGIALALVGAMLTTMVYQQSAKAYSYAGVKWSNAHADFYLDTAGWDPNLVINPSFAWTNAGSRFYFTYRGNNIQRFGDGINSVSRYTLNSSAIATTTNSYVNGALTETDTVMNMQYAWGCCGESGMYDVMNVMTHEFGHWLKLNDLYVWPIDAEKTMYGGGALGETKKRSLESDDVNGIRSIYPR